MEVHCNYEPLYAIWFYCRSIAISQNLVQFHLWIPSSLSASNVL